MMPNAVGLLAIRSERSIRAPPPASADWSMPPADIADTNTQTWFHDNKRVGSRGRHDTTSKAYKVVSAVFL